MRSQPVRHRSPGLGAIAAVGGLGFLAGLALPHARKAVAQGPSLAAGDWVAALKAEHRLVEGLFEKLLATTQREKIKREMLLTKIAYALTKHAVEEENVIYPALAEGGRKEASSRLTAEHAEIKTFIYDLRRLSSGDARWIVKAREFEQHIARHVREEEDEIFPAFRAALGDRENGKLTMMLNWEGFKVA